MHIRPLWETHLLWFVNCIPFIGSWATKTLANVLELIFALVLFTTHILRKFDIFKPYVRKKAFPNKNTLKFGRFRQHLKTTFGVFFLARNGLYPTHGYEMSNFRKIVILSPLFCKFDFMCFDEQTTLHILFFLLVMNDSIFPCCLFYASS